MRSLRALVFVPVIIGGTVQAQTEILAIEFVQDDQAGFDLWPSAFSGTSSTANFTTDGSVTSGTTTVEIETSTTFGVPGNRGSSDGNPAGYSYQHLYEDLLIATSPTGFLTLNFSGLNPETTYQLTLYAWDPGAGDASDKVWSVTGGAGNPASSSVNFQDPLIDNESFGMDFEITTTAGGTFQLTNTAGLPQSAINGFSLAIEEVDPNAPPEIVSQPSGVWNGEEVVIELVVNGAEPISFQWYFDGVIIPGANQESLTLDASEWDQDGDYTVRVSNANGFVDSDPSAITIDIPQFPTREQLTYEPIGPSSRRSGISISEILYHPAQQLDGRELEFIELYNSQPWPEDIAGWRLSGDIDFVFPNGTSVPALGYLVVAKAPGDVESHYGISEVVGPWTDKLPNEGGRIRLRKPSGAIVLEVNYDDRDPWPLAADGAGHSLILARPSYGERDERAWEQSHSIGGSPGAVDPVPTGLLDHVFVWWVEPNSEIPGNDMVTLRNAGRSNVDVSGCTLSNDRNALARFTIPEGTIISAGDPLQISESELGFGFDAWGDEIFLTDSTGQRVLDASFLPAVLPDEQVFRRRIDGPVELPGRSIRINEFMFHPPTHDDADEWVEIFNISTEPRDLSGWAFTDGVDFVFPEGSSIPARGFLVIAKDRTQTLANHPGLDPNLVLGDYSGNLSDGGERVVLSRLHDGRFVIEDEIGYRDKSRWSHFADGRGSTLNKRLTGRVGSIPGQLGG